MTLSIDQILANYIRGEISLADLRRWLALEQWDLAEPAAELADEVDGALVDLSNGYTDERGFREHVSFLLSQYTTQFVPVYLSPRAAAKTACL